MKCPVCGKDMEKGYIMSNGAVISWGKEKPNMFMLSGELLIARTVWSIAYNEAFHCHDCRMVATQYSEELNKGEKIKQETDRQWKQRQEIANGGKKP